ncbi:hypothetical protein BJV77DRAFT_193587, partial [Russula vinacea]
TNISTQTSELFRSTSRPGPTQLQGASQPHSIAELAEHAKQSLGDVSRPFEAWLRIAENARRDAKSFYELGDVESAFVEYGKAAIILLEKIPGHPDYKVLPSTTQRQNMGVVSYPYSLCLYDCASVATTTAVGHVHVLY